MKLFTAGHGATWLYVELPSAIKSRALHALNRDHMDIGEGGIHSSLLSVYCWNSPSAAWVLSTKPKHFPLVNTKPC